MTLLIYFATFGSSRVDTRMVAKKKKKKRMVEIQISSQLRWAFSHQKPDLYHEVKRPHLLVLL